MEQDFIRNQVSKSDDLFHQRAEDTFHEVICPKIYSGEEALQALLPPIHHESGNSSAEVPPERLRRDWQAVLSSDFDS